MLCIDYNSTYMSDIPEVTAHCDSLCSQRTAAPNQSNLCLARSDLLKECPLGINPVTLQGSHSNRKHSGRI